MRFIVVGLLFLMQLSHYWPPFTGKKPRLWKGAGPAVLAPPKAADPSIFVTLVLLTKTPNRNNLQVGEFILT